MLLMKYLFVLLFAFPVLAADLEPFTSDGCSKFPDGNYLECCQVHDLTYWGGGTQQEKIAADKNLARCVFVKTGSTQLSSYMFLGVLFGGSPHFGTSFRWGYGWPQGRGYRPLSRKEKRALAASLRNYSNHDVDGAIIEVYAKKISPIIRPRFE